MLAVTIKEFMEPDIVWVILGLIMMFSEILIPGLVIFFFGIGALIVGGICHFIDISINMQIIIFLVSSGVLLLTLRLWLKKIFIGYSSAKQSGDKQIVDNIGERAVVTQTIDPPKKGKVEFRGSNWNAISQSVIEEGITVEITGQKNITLEVKPLK